MFVLGLLTCIALRAFSAQAEVVDSFKKCKEFFYKDTEPGGMSQNARKICQKYEEGGSYYATLYYSVPHRIPLYSAYTFDPKCFSSERSNNWHVEPQISDPQSKIKHMVLEKDLSDYRLKEDVIKKNQAMSSDYSDTGYDRGHLNPNSFNCYEGRTATYTLTNAVPMDACFNQIHWKNWEMNLRKFLKQQFESDHDDQESTDTTIYIVTGTVPAENQRIPQKEQRVTVPSHIWTAVCYKHSEDGKSFSFSFMGENRPAEPDISIMSVSNLNDRLSELYSELFKTPQSVKIFLDDCFEDNNKLNKVQTAFKKLTDLPRNKGVEVTSDALNTLTTLKRTIGSDRLSSTSNLKVKKVEGELVFDSINTYSTMAEEMKSLDGSACLITNPKPLSKRGELRKREVSEGSDAVECLLVPEKQKTAADGSQCLSVSESSDGCVCNLADKTKPCCSSPCLYQNKLKGYKCNSGQTLIECSPRYSLVTAYGKRCRDDHPCATYGEAYYWCNTVSGSWDYCSPPLWRSKAINGKPCISNHACAKYGSEKPWCYTDDQGSYDKCCTFDDCFSAENGQTCRSDHPCGKHGKQYLWCYTDNKGNWDYCCTDCSQ
ncbi:uncharacterized protein LOC120481479 [Pimephales promelas]|uniref:uncharacterized protein LOC120481479 n=1 Tax=Pimephales promelas TaxID=90988 RepID=UPI0019554FE8|nr:uncharacterized protein LOC120481479 [Pimephales promelas]KAG1926567.1 endonuclease domain-containing 1 protein-like [Pimephales promelas]